jgi:adenylate cyclase
MFGPYVSPNLVEKMIEAGEDPKLGGHEAAITPFFASLHNYVGLAEKLPLQQLPELMNAYFTACTDAICAEGGTLDKYIGDAIVAMFGAPIALPDHALRACVAALRCQDEVARLRERFQREAAAWPEEARRLRLRIGLNTGPVIIGNFGSRTRFNYTMMGDNVNLAARMESGAKSWGVWTMCTDATKERLRADRRATDSLSLAGRSHRDRAEPAGGYFRADGAAVGGNRVDA